MKIQQRLEPIFRQGFQLKRVLKQIDNLRDAKPKLGFEMRFTLTKQIQLSIVIEISKQKLKEIKKLTFLQKLQFKIVLKNSYPTTQPRLYILLQNALELGINPYDDYMNVIFPEWNARVTVLDIVKVVPAFIIRCAQKSGQIRGIHHLNQYFEAQRLFSFQGCQSFPVKLLKGNDELNGLIVLVGGQELVILQQTNFQGSFITSEFIQISQVISLQKHKTKHLRCLLQLKRGGTKFALQFSSDEYDTIIGAVVESMKATQLLQTGKQPVQSSDSDQQENMIQVKPQQNQQLIINDSNIKEVQSQIIILQSLADTKPTTGTINQLVQLLKKAVQFYSAKGDQRCQIYLRNLQNIMNNELMQALLTSEGNDRKTISKKEYESIANLV